MSERSHCHTEGTVNLPIIFDNLLFFGLMFFSVLVNYIVYIHTYSTYIHTEAQIKLNHNFTVPLRAGIGPILKIFLC